MVFDSTNCAVGMQLTPEPLQETKTISPVRGLTAVLVCGACLSFALALAAIALWLMNRMTNGQGYNSRINAFILGGHAFLSSLGGVVWHLVARPRSSGVAKALLGSYLFVTLLVYAEVLASGLFSRGVPQDTPYVSEPTAGWRMRANYSGTYLGKKLRTNSDGFRSPDLVLEKAANTSRVVCLGDSLTFGHGLEDHEAYPQQLERLLNDRVPTRRWEVINTGVEGFCTYQETGELRRCLKYQPDVAVLLFCLNDVTEKYLSLRRFRGTGLEYHGVADGSGGRFFQALVALRPHSSLITALTPTQADAQRREAYSVRMLWEQPEVRHVRAAWGQAESELDELRELCASHGIALLIAAAPYLAQFADTPGIGAPQRRIARYAESHGVEFADLKPFLDAAATPANLPVKAFYMDEAHMTGAGNTVIAQTLVAKVAHLVSDSSRGSGPR